MNALILDGVSCAASARAGSGVPVFDWSKFTATGLLRLRLREVRCYYENTWQAGNAEYVPENAARTLV